MGFTSCYNDYIKEKMKNHNLLRCKHVYEKSLVRWQQFVYIFESIFLVIKEHLKKHITVGKIVQFQTNKYMYEICVVNKNGFE